jgi:hypothetical protein
MERASLEIVRDLISAEVGWRRRVAVRTAMKRRFCIFEEEEGERVVVVVVVGGGERSG